MRRGGDWVGAGWAEEGTLLLELFQLSHFDAARVGMSLVSCFSSLFHLASFELAFAHSLLFGGLLCEG